ncbi:MAG: DUF1788 domain-containing protein [Chloroflexi bacterium]|nr:DUF1788 domain-containing protein [Chloroflexota bacterium]
MSEIDDLIHEYEDVARLPWDRTLAGAQKVWFAIYEPSQERRVRLRIHDFEVATRNAGHAWALVDLTDAFAKWMSQHKYREAYFEQPEDMELALQGFAGYAAKLVQDTLTSPEVGEDAVVAVLGIGSLFGLTRASVLFETVAPFVRGRLLGFFPGRHEGSNYRLLDARDGWNYLAIAITAKDRSSKK